MRDLASLTLVLKAEALLAVQLVIRHRAPRLTATLVLLAVFLAGATGRHGVAPLLLAAGALGAVAGSRPLARGPALGAARTLAARPWIPVAGRFLGLLATVLPVAAVAASVLAPPAAAAFLSAFVASGMLGAALTALVLGLAPFIGATVAATVGLGLALAGEVTPADLAVLGVAAPALERAAMLLWEVLPLPWRAARWQATAWTPDLLCLAAWTAAGLVAASLGVRGRGRS